MTKDIMQIIERRAEIRVSILTLKNDYESALKGLNEEDKELERLENIFSDDLASIHMIQIAESLLIIYGDGVDKFVEGRKLTEAAALDIATGCKHLRSRYFGNKTYEGFYQSTDCEYGYGPRHGGIVDKVGLKNPAKALTKEESEACIYYLKNYSKIKSYSKVS